MKSATIFSAIAVLVITTAYLSTSSEGPLNPGGTQARAMCIGGHCCCMRSAETQTVAANSFSSRLTLDPDQFMGPVKQAYTFAGHNPALLAQLWCYCGCDKTAGHKSLLDCYRDRHGATCNICSGEALQAQQMSEQGSPVDQIRDALRRRYAGEN
jgi:hypothetical protein